MSEGITVVNNEQGKEISPQELLQKLLASEEGRALLIELYEEADEVGHKENFRAKRHQINDALTRNAIERRRAANNKEDQ